MSAEALRWFDKAARKTKTAAEYVVLHVLCAQDPRSNPGGWFKPNLSEVRRRSPVNRETASRLLHKLASLALIDHRTAKSARVKGSIRIRLEETFSDVIEEDPENPNCDQRSQSGVTRDHSELCAEITESVTRDHTTHIQKQATGGATPKPEPVACFTEGTDAKEQAERQARKRYEELSGIPDDSRTTGERLEILKIGRSLGREVQF